MFSLAVIDSIRRKAIQIINESSIEDLNKIPDGFNNNIVWNFGHLVVSGYSLVFRVTGVDPELPISYLDKYKKGTRPEPHVTREEIDDLIGLSGQFIPTVQQALQAGRFEKITEYTTGTFGVPNTNIEEMLSTVALHDSVHWQCMKHYQRFLSSKL
jgi:hypothetical protein